MAFEQPLLSLAATSVADDLGFVALADLAAVLPEKGDFRLVGGHMVTLHVHRLGLGAELYRETADADLGATPLMLADGTLVERLERLGYHQAAGDRWVRPLAGLSTATGVAAEAAIDLLIPAYQSRARQNVAVGERITALEVPGLPDALNRSPVVVALRLVRLDGSILQARLPIPDVPASLGLKAFAWASRQTPKDAVDLWRCLEVARADGVGPDEFTTGRLPEAAGIIRSVLRRPDGPALLAAARQRGLAGEARLRFGTRVAALITSALGPDTDE